MSYDLKAFYNSVDQLTTRDRAISVLYGRLPDGMGGGILPINVDAAGNLLIGTDITLNVSEITPVNCVQPDATLLNTTTNVQFIGGSSIGLGQRLSVTSIPVVLATDQSPIPVIVSTGSVGTPVFQYGEQLAVAVSGTVTLVSYTVPVGHTFTLQTAEVSGDNVGLYVLTVGGATVSKRRTSFAEYNSTFPTLDVSAIAGQIITLVATNEGTSAAGFNGTIYGQLI